MIPAIALRHGGATEFRAKNNERFIKHATLFQILDKCGCSTIDFFRSTKGMIFYRPMMIPIAMIKLDEPDATLGQSSCQKAVACKRAIAWICAIRFQHFFWFLRNIHEFGNTGLHAKCKFVLCDARFDFRVCNNFVFKLIKRLDRLDQFRLP